MPYKDKEKQRAAQAKWYQENKAKQQTRNKHSERTLIKLVREAKNKPCTDCGNSYPHYVMQFDHIGTDKVGGVSRMMRTHSTRAVLDEIAKCEVVCANCHMERTWQRQNKLAPLTQLAE